MTGVFEDHLGLDAIVAYVDGELSLTAFQRVSAHLWGCPRCAAEVADQSVAQQMIRSAGLPRMPGSLLDALKSIPVALPTQRPAPGLAVDSISGQVSRSAEFARPNQIRGRRFKFGAGALVAGIAVGALVVAAAGEHPGRPALPERSPDVARVASTSTSASVVDVRAVSPRR